MSADTNDPAYRDYLTNRYIDPGPSVETAAIKAEAEQHVPGIVDIEQACKEYNAAQDPTVAWAAVGWPGDVRTLIELTKARVRESQRREIGTYVQQFIATVDTDDDDDGELIELPVLILMTLTTKSMPFGIAVADPETIHVFQADYGPRQFLGYAENRTTGVCDTCGHKGTPRDMLNVALANGMYMWFLTICAGCNEDLAHEYTTEHPGRRASWWQKTCAHLKGKGPGVPPK